MMPRGSTRTRTSWIGSHPQGAGRRSRPVPLLVAWTLILLCAPRAASSKELLLFDPDPAASTSADEVRRAYLWQFAGRQQPELLGVDNLLQGQGEILLLGEAALDPCEAEPAPPEAFDELVARAAGSVAYVDYADGAAALGSAQQVLPCLAGPVSPEALSRYYFLRGVVAYYNSGPEEARVEFRAGLLVSPFLQWDPVFPPDALPAFESALSDALKADRAFLSISEAALAGGRLWLDGVQVDPRTRTTPIFAGTHLVQWSSDEGAFRTFAARVQAGATAELAARRDLVSGFLARSGSRFQLDFVDGLVTGTLGDQARPVVVAQPGPVVLFHRREAGREEWQLADLGALEARIEGGRQRRVIGGVLMGAGIAAGVVGSALAAAASSQATSIHGDLFPGPLMGTTAGEFNALEPRYEALQDQCRGGWALAIAGGATTAAAIPILGVGSTMAPPRRGAGRSKSGASADQGAGPAAGTGDAAASP